MQPSAEVDFLYKFPFVFFYLHINKDKQWRVARIKIFIEISVEAFTHFVFLYKADVAAKVAEELLTPPRSKCAQNNQRIVLLSHLQLAAQQITRQKVAGLPGIQKYSERKCHCPISEIFLLYSEANPIFYKAWMKTANNKTSRTAIWCLFEIYNYVIVIKIKTVRSTDILH